MKTKNINRCELKNFNKQKTHPVFYCFTGKDKKL